MYEIYEKIRDKHKMSDYMVAREIGVSRTILSDWKNKKSKPSTNTLEKIADYFNVSVDYLLGRAV